MEIFRFDSRVGRKIERYDSDRLVLTPLVHLTREAQLGCMYLGPGGVVGYHRAVVPQLFLVVLEEYLGLQRLIYHVAEALRQVVPTERVFLLSLGGQQGNRHLHWHVVPLPPDVPYEEQQLQALSWEKGAWICPRRKWRRWPPASGVP